MKFRKKPVVIEAFRYQHGDPPRWFLDAVESGDVELLPKVARIWTLEGEIYASRGDWIIRGVKGELYPCRPDIFDATYEPVEES